MGCVYQVKNKVNGMCYVGKTIRPLKRRIDHHLSNALGNKDTTYFHNALKKYGPENFEWSILTESSDNDELNRVEILSIKTLNCKAPHGYNLTEGGEGTLGFKYWLGKHHSEATRLKIGDVQRGRKQSEESKIKRSIALKGKRNALGFKHTSEAKERIRLSALGRKASEETRIKISNAKRGEKHGSMPIELRNRIRLKMLGRTYAKGYRHTKEAKEKISKASRGRVFSEESKEKMRIAAVRREFLKKQAVL